MRTEPMKREQDAELALPEGKRCQDCYHFRRCEAMFGHIAQDEICDWVPIRFIPTPPAEAGKAG